MIGKCTNDIFTHVAQKIQDNALCVHCKFPLHGTQIIRVSLSLFLFLLARTIPSLIPQNAAQKEVSAVTDQDIQVELQSHLNCAMTRAYERLSLQMMIGPGKKTIMCKLQVDSIRSGWFKHKSKQRKPVFNATKEAVKEWWDDCSVSQWFLEI